MRIQLTIWALISCFGIGHVFASEKPNLKPIFEQALKEENLQNWPEAIRLYVKLTESESIWKKTATKRITSILMAIQQDGGDIRSLEGLLSESLKNELKQQSFFAQAVPEPSSSSNYLFISFIVLLFFLIGVSIFFLRKPSRRNEFKIKPPSKFKFHPFRSDAGSSSVPTQVPKPEMFVHEHTRIRIRQLLDTIPTDDVKPVDPPEINKEALTSSPILEHLAKEFVSDVKTEETEFGKTSYMTIQAEIIFDENEGGDGSSQ